MVPDFCGDRMSLFCGVFDGHGGTGDLCSNFVSKKLPTVSIYCCGRSLLLEGLVVGCSCSWRQSPLVPGSVR